MWRSASSSERRPASWPWSPSAPAPTSSRRGFVSRARPDAAQSSSTSPAWWRWTGWSERGPPSTTWSSRPGRWRRARRGRPLRYKRNRRRPGRPRGPRGAVARRRLEVELSCLHAAHESVPLVGVEGQLARVAVLGVAHADQPVAYTDLDAGDEIGRERRLPERDINELPIPHESSLSARRRRKRPYCRSSSGLNRKDVPTFGPFDASEE